MFAKTNVFIFSISLWIITNCNNKPYRPYTMQVGEAVTLRGTTVGEYKKNVSEIRSNVLLLINKGGLQLDFKDDFTLEFYRDSSTKEPGARYSSRELATMADQTKCSRQLKDYLTEQAGTGYTLFCHDSLNIKNYSYFKLILDGKVKEATSYSVYFSTQEDQLIGVSLIFN